MVALSTDTISGTVPDDLLGPLVCVCVGCMLSAKVLFGLFSCLLTGHLYASLFFILHSLAERERKKRRRQEFVVARVSPPCPAASVTTWAFLAKATGGWQRLQAQS